MKLFGFEIRRAEKQMSPVDSGRGGWWPLIRESFAGAWQENVEVRTADVLAYHAVFACMTLIAGDISKLRIKYVTRDNNNIWTEDFKNPAYTVLRKPNDFQTRQQFIESWIISKLSHGNTYALKERDASMRVRKLYILDPTNVVVLVSESGDVFYRINRDDLSGVEQQITIPASEIIHDRFNCFFHPLVGLSPIYACGLAATQGLRIQNNSTHFFGNASRPAGIISTADSIDDDTAKRLKDYWQANFTGKNAGNVAILGDGLKFDQMGVTAHDSQLVEQLGWTVEVVCSTFHVPPYKIGHGTIPANNNVQALNLEYYVSALQTLIEAMEACLDEGLGMDGVNAGTELDTKNLLRMDSVTQMQVLREGIGGAILAPNEARRDLDLVGVSGGESPMIQEQNYSLAAIAKRDAREDPFAKGATTTPAAAPVANDNEDEELQSEARAALVEIYKGLR